MKLIITLFFAGIALIGCRDKELPSKYLTNISVIRNIEKINEQKQTLPETNAQPEEKKPQPESSTPKQQVQHSEYHIIVASFGYSERDKAEKLVKNLKEKGFPATIIDSKKRYRVSIESLSDLQEAESARDQYRKITDMDGIWILKTDK